MSNPELSTCNPINFKRETLLIDKDQIIQELRQKIDKLESRLEKEVLTKDLVI